MTPPLEVAPCPVKTLRSSLMFTGSDSRILTGAVIDLTVLQPRKFLFDPTRVCMRPITAQESPKLPARRALPEKAPNWEVTATHGGVPTQPGRTPCSSRPNEDLEILRLRLAVLGKPCVKLPNLALARQVLLPQAGRFHFPISLALLQGSDKGPVLATAHLLSFVSRNLCQVLVHHPCHVVRAKAARRGTVGRDPAPSKLAAANSRPNPQPSFLSPRLWSSSAPICRAAREVAREKLCEAKAPSASHCVGTGTHARNSPRAREVAMLPAVCNQLPARARSSWASKSGASGQFRVHHILVRLHLSWAYSPPMGSQPRVESRLHLGDAPALRNACAPGSGHRVTLCLEEPHRRQR